MKKVKELNIVAKKHGKLNNKNALKPINESQVYKLAQKRWTITEIAAFFDCAFDTIKNRFSNIITKGHENYNTKLREAQSKAAMNGNVTMLIWLGKQYLGQVDKQETEVTLPQEIVIQLPPSFNDN